MMNEKPLWDYLKWYGERLEVIEHEMRTLQEDHRHVMRTIKVLSLAVFSLSLAIIAVNFNLWSM